MATSSKNKSQPFYENDSEQVGSKSKKAKLGTSNTNETTESSDCDMNESDDIQSILILDCHEIIKDIRKFNKFINDNLKDIQVRNIRKTKNGNIQIYVENNFSVNEILTNEDRFPGKLKVQANKKLYSIVLKGLNYEQARIYKEQLEEEYGVIDMQKITSFKNKNQVVNKTIIKVADKQTADRLIQDKIKLDHVRYNVEEYKKPIRLLQCFKCQKFGHVAKQCRLAKTICQKCGRDDHNVDDNNKLICNMQTRSCINCGQSGHSAAYPLCPKKKELIQQIKERQTNRANTQQSLQAPTNQQSSYASIVQNVNNKVHQVTRQLEQKQETSLNQVNDKLNQIISNQQTIINELKKRVDTLESKIEQLVAEKEQQNKVNTFLLSTFIDSQFLAGAKFNDAIVSKFISTIKSCKDISIMTEEKVRESFERLVNRKVNNNNNSNNRLSLGNNPSNNAPKTSAAATKTTK